MSSSDLGLSSSDHGLASNTTQPLSSYDEVALQELWARIIAALGDPSLVAARPKTSGAAAAAAATTAAGPPSDEGMAFKEHYDTKKRHLFRVPVDVFRETMYMHFQGANPDWVCAHMLRANGNDPDGALRDLFYHVSWRKYDMKVDDELLRRGEAGFVRTLRDPRAPKRARVEAEGVMHIIRNGTAQILRGLDRQRRIILYVRVRLHKGYHFPNKCYRILSTYYSEYCRLQMAGDIDEILLLFDLGDAGLLNMDDRPIRNFIETARDIYPQGLGDVIMHRMPKTFAPLWRIAKLLIRPEFVRHIHFTRNLEELEQYIPRDVIPAELGGGDDTVFEYREPDLDDPMNGGGSAGVQEMMRAERARLLEERRQIGDTFVDMTKQWIEVARSGRDPTEAQTMREKVAEELVANYWRLDPYSRARSHWDRVGMLPQPEVDLSKFKA